MCFQYFFYNVNTTDYRPTKQTIFTLLETKWKVFPASRCNFLHNNWLIYYFKHASRFLFCTGDCPKIEFNKVRAVEKLRQVDAPITALIYMEMEMVTNQFLSFE